MVIAVLTGDIIASTQAKRPAEWRARLKESFKMVDSDRSEMFRGDSFQLELLDAERALQAAITIRAGIRSVKSLYRNGTDVRIAIGIGEQGNRAEKVSESDGDAYRFSGRLLDELMTNGTKLALRSQWPDLDQEMAPALGMASAVIDDWSHASAEAAWLSLTTEAVQLDLAERLKISQPSVHKRLSKSHLSQLRALIDRFATRVRKCLDPQSSLAIIQKIRSYGIRPSIETYNHLMELTREFRTGRRIMEEMEQQGILPNEPTYTTLMKLSKDFETASKLLHEMERQDIQPNVATYTTLMKLSKDFETASKLLHEMERQGIQPNVVAYTTLMKLSKDFETASKLLHEMERQGIQPNVVTYTTLMKLSKDFETASKLLHEMERQDIQPNVATYTSLMELSKDFETALELLREMQQQSLRPGVLTYNALIRLSDNFDSASTLLDDMIRQGLTPDPSTYMLLTKKDGARH